MKPTWLPTAIGALVLAVPAARGVDLAQIDRTIRKEPAYQSKTPQYCLLVFGPEAKTKVWLVVDGDTLYVDQDGKGDLTQAKRVKLVPYQGGGFFKAGDVTVTDNQTKYISSGDWYYHVRDNFARIDIRTSDNWKYAAFPRFADQPLKAPIVHFGGPLTMSLGHNPPKLLNPGDTVGLAPRLGTPGLGDRTFATVLAFPGVSKQDRQAGPQAEIEFPPKSVAGNPIKRMVEFKWDEC